MMLSFIAPDRFHELVFEDDGRVAYAYLKTSDRQIVGDVWLYNRCPTPASPEWHDRSKIPFANSKDFVTDMGHLDTELENDDIRVSWESELGSTVAYVYIRGDLYGIVGNGDKPGYARAAKSNGPLARVMEIAD